MSLERKPRCIICNKLGELHHLLHEGSHSEFKDEPWNLMPLCREHHTQMHAKNKVWMAERWPSVLKWLKKNNWCINKTLNKWWPPVWQ